MQSLQQHVGCYTAQQSAWKRRSLVVAAAKSAKSKSAVSTSSKGFGAPKPEKVVLKDGCPCGSNKHYKSCCKPYHVGEKVAPTVEATVRARFSAILKKEVSYLLNTTHPDFHSFQYGTEPGAALRTLQDDLWNTVDHYDYSNLRIKQVQPGDKPDEQIATFQYTVFDERTPLIDDQGNKSRKVQIEQSRFVQDSDSKTWQFVDYKMVEVPEALARTAELQAKDMAATAAAAPGEQEA
eukprot:GHUV01009011.1.p1 GENE.GHUV01009011.1~~GHUV01009011.1.p1  ORF type:complete len:237 (+),score=78.13 GHUV01009011.1:554-1264(+)